MFILVEGHDGSVELAPDFWLRTTTESGTHSRRVPQPSYAWADSRYDLVHSSIVASHVDCLEQMRGGREAETSGRDNLKTLELVFAAYDAARSGQTVALR